MVNCFLLIIQGKLNSLKMISNVMFVVNESSNSNFKNQLIGATKETSVNGVFENINLYLIAEPGSSQSFEITTNAIDNFSMTVWVSLRDCIAGEEFTEIGE